jgi:hypothetical protein
MRFLQLLSTPQHLLSGWAAAIIFFIPVNVFYVLNPGGGYNNGLRIDYLLGKVYLTDILIVGFLCTVCWIYRERLFTGLRKRLAKNNLWFFAGAAGSLLAAQILSPVPVATALWIFHLLLAIGWGVSLFYLKVIISKRWIVVGLAGAVGFQLLVGSGQFIVQESVFPSYRWFGEPRLSASAIGLARTQLLGAERILAYGTTPHPNIFAGTIVLFGVLIISLVSGKLKHPAKMAVIAAMILSACIAQSISAALAAGIGIAAFLPGVRKRYMPAGTAALIAATATAGSAVLMAVAARLFPDSLSIVRRNLLNEAALMVFYNRPLTGVGLGALTAVTEPLLRSKEMVRFIQPAHNGLVLLLAEAGILGTAVAGSALSAIRNYRLHLSVLALLPLLALDHYVITLVGGQLAAATFLSLLARHPNATQDQ